MENNPRKEESLGYFNLARGIGMIIILFGHSVTPFLIVPEKAFLFSGWGSVLGGGILAMFFMISGFGFYKRSPKKCLSIQAKLLLRPYCIVAVLVLITKIILAFVEQRSFWEHGGEMILTYLLGLNAEGGGELHGITIETISIFWFILALFGAWNIYNAIMQLKSEKIQNCLIIGCVVLSYLLSLISKLWPFCIPMALMAVGYLAVGNFIRKHHLMTEKLPVWCWVAILTVTLISAAFGEVNIVSCVWRLGLIDVAGSFCMGFLLLRLYARVMKRDWHGRIVGFLEEIGFNSIWIVCIHAYEKITFPWYRLPIDYPDHLLLGAIFCLVGRCVVMYVLYQLVVTVSRKWKKKKKRRKKKTILEGKID